MFICCFVETPMACKLYDVCRWHITMTKRLYNGLPTAVVSEPVVFKSCFLSHSFHQTVYFVYSNSVSFEPVFGSKWLQFQVVYCQIKGRVSVHHLLRSPFSKMFVNHNRIFSLPSVANIFGVTGLISRRCWPISSFGFPLVELQKLFPTCCFV